MKFVIRFRITDRTFAVTRELKLKTVIIDNFVPPAQLKALLARVEFAEEGELEGDGWRLAAAPAPALAGRPVSASGGRRPVSEYAKRAGAAGGGTRFKVGPLVVGVGWGQMGVWRIISE